MVDFKAGEEGRLWFERQPYEVCVAVAARAALRVLPQIVAGERQTTGFFHSLVLPCFRAVAAAWIAAKFPTRVPERYIAASIDDDRSLHSYAAGRAAYAAARTAFDTVAPHWNAAVAARCAAEAAVYTSAGGAPRGSASGSNRTALNADVLFVESETDPRSRALLASKLAGDPLWPDAVPVAISASWRQLKSVLLRADRNWAVWTDWYEDRLLGRTADDKLEIARVMVPEALWRDGPDTVNSEIRRLIEAHTPIDPIPPQGAGPHFDLSSAHRIALAAVSEIDTAGNNMSRLREQLPLVREAAADLASRLNPNAFPELTRNLAAYRAAIEGNPEKIPWGIVFGRGIRLDNAAAAARRQIEDRLQPTLEDAAQEALETVLTLHGPIILATAEGRELMSDADHILLGRAEQVALRDHALAVAAALNEDNEIIEPPAAEIVMESVEAMGEGAHPERGWVIGSAAIRNVTIWAVGIGAVAAIAGVGLVQAGAAVIAIEGLKKSTKFSALTDALGARIDGVLRTGTAFQNFVLRNEQPLRQLASNSAGMRWMLPYIDDVVRRNAGKSPPVRP